MFTKPHILGCHFTIQIHHPACKDHGQIQAIPAQVELLKWIQQYHRAMTDEAIGSADGADDVEATVQPVNRDIRRCW